MEPSDGTAILKALGGGVIDADSHEMVPAHLWGETFGEGTLPFAQLVQAEHELGGINSFVADVSARDEGPIAEEMPSWRAGVEAPGAYSLARRLDWLDHCGIERQFIFPTGPGLLGMFFLSVTPERVKEIFGFDLTPEALRSFALGNIDGYNQWAMKAAAFSHRLRPVAVVDTTYLAGAVETTKRLIAAGIRAVFIPSGIPVGGMSPGHPDVGEFWEVLEENDVALLLHAGGDFGFLRSGVWGIFGDELDRANSITGKKLQTQEVPLGPYPWCQVGIGNQNFVLAMIFGGAFERHPRLRLGCIESGAQWIGPLVENMERVGAEFPRWTKHLSLSPREYVERNIRVNPLYWEPIDKYIERYGLEDVYVYGSDYPHYEGGQNPAVIYAERLAPLGPEVLRKFFIENGRLLWP